MSSDSFDPEYDSIKTNRSKPPLRWIANWAGSIASSAILRASFLEEDDEMGGFKYKFNLFIWDKLWPIYEKYGTFYTLQPYWERTGMVDPDYTPAWDFEDENGDAFRIIRNGN